MLQEVIREHQVAAAAGLQIILARQHDTHVHSSVPRPHQGDNHPFVEEVGVLEVDVALRFANGPLHCGAERLPGGLGGQQTHADPMVRGEGWRDLLRAASQLGDVGEVAQPALVCPVMPEFIFEGGDHRSLQLDHQVVPLVAVFAAQVHAAHPRMGAVHQEHF